MFKGNCTGAQISDDIIMLSEGKHGSAESGENLTVGFFFLFWDCMIFFLSLVLQSQPTDEAKRGREKKCKKKRGQSEKVQCMWEGVSLRSRSSPEPPPPPGYCVFPTKT